MVQLHPLGGNKFQILHMWVVQVSQMTQVLLKLRFSYSNGKTLRLLKLVFFTYKGAGILQTYYPKGVSHTHFNWHVTMNIINIWILLEPLAYARSIPTTGLGILSQWNQAGAHGHGRVATTSNWTMPAFKPITVRWITFWPALLREDQEWRKHTDRRGIATDQETSTK